MILVALSLSGEFVWAVARYNAERCLLCNNTGDTLSLLQFHLVQIPSSAKICCLFWHDLHAEFNLYLEKWSIELNVHSLFPERFHHDQSFWQNMHAFMSTFGTELLVSFHRFYGGALWRNIIASLSCARIESKVPEFTDCFSAESALEWVFEL